VVTELFSSPSLHTAAGPCLRGVVCGLAGAAVLCLVCLIKRHCFSTSTDEPQGVCLAQPAAHLCYVSSNGPVSPHCADKGLKAAAWLSHHCTPQLCLVLNTDVNCANPFSAADEGPKAAAWLSQQCTSFPVLRPLCLVIRGLLAEQRLADAATGGLRCACILTGAILLDGLLAEQQASWRMPPREA